MSNDLEQRALSKQTAIAFARSLLAEQKQEPVAWLALADAPMWVYGRDALVGEYVEGYGWRKVAVWEPGWTRDDCIARGATHWWPHLRDLPIPGYSAPPAEQEPLAWRVELADSSYVIDDINDPQAVDDLTNHGATLTPLYAAPPAQAAQTRAQLIDRMVDAFLRWPLPSTFSPDHGINFDGCWVAGKSMREPWPTGTNLFTAREARQMIEHMFTSAAIEEQP